MKKNIAIILVLIMVLSMVGCGSSSKEPEPTPEPTANPIVELTKDNILDYVQFDGVFVDGKYTMGIVNRAEATLEFQTYPVASGKFSNVEITLIATSNEHAFTYMNDLGNYWHLTDADNDTKKIEFTIKLGIDGKFSKNYNVKCLNNTGKLSGSCDFEIVSVSGMFEPD